MSTLSNGDLLSHFSYLISLCVSKMILLWLAISLTHQPILIIFLVDSDVILLSTVCKYYFSLVVKIIFCLRRIADFCSFR